MAKLNANTVLANPETGQPTVILAGEDAPKWAEGLIGDHLVESGKQAAKSSGKSEK